MVQNPLHNTIINFKHFTYIYKLIYNYPYINSKAYTQTYIKFQTTDVRITYITYIITYFINIYNTVTCADRKYKLECKLYTIYINNN